MLETRENEFIDDLSFEYSFDANEGTILYMDGTTSRSALAFSASVVILNYYSGEMFWCPQATIGCDDTNDTGFVTTLSFSVLLRRVLVQKWRNIESNVHLSGQFNRNVEQVEVLDGIGHQAEALKKSMSINAIIRVVCVSQAARPKRVRTHRDMPFS
ncbi:hypothetical protein SADUNF_Sadunf17G0102300 [Salix dunnii]|uniref:Uncharacterized protein n=1 Tax=Salix dunnii TaxID=1413687 RepID=A0A835MK64_9ROSI|nr:hypothetical protein SADUNF_Sadunf17G0102300 [Salix dunnii]